MRMLYASSEEGFEKLALNCANPGPSAGPLAIGIRVQIWTHCGWSLLPRRRIRHDGLQARWLAQPQPLV